MLAGMQAQPESGADVAGAEAARQPDRLHIAGLARPGHAIPAARAGGLRHIWMLLLARCMEGLVGQQTAIDRRQAAGPGILVGPDGEAGLSDLMGLEDF